MKRKYKFILAFTLSAIGLTPFLSSCANNSISSNNNNNGNNNNSGNGNNNNGVTNKIVNLNKYSNITKENSLTNRIQSNGNYSLTQILDIGNQFVNSFTDEFKKELIVSVVKNYYYNYVNSKGGKALISDEKISFDNNKITIFYKIVYQQKFNNSFVAEQRNVNDFEEYIVTFDLPNTKIVPYINGATTNYLSFKFKPESFIKKLWRNDSSNYEYQIIDKTIEFNTDNQELIHENDVYPLSIDFNNSLNSIDLNAFLQNSYSYNRASTTEQAFYLETIKLLENREKNLYFDVDQVNSYYPILSASGFKIHGIIEQKTKLDISLITNEFLSNLAQELITLYNFSSSIKCASNGKDNFIYVEPTVSAPIKTILAKDNNNQIIDLTTNLNYQNDYRSFLIPNNSYKDLIEIKNAINEVFLANIAWINIELKIQITKDEIENDFDSFVNKLDTTSKLKLIYQILLPQVSYGQKNANCANIIGFIEKKFLCQGYAMTLSYLANIFKIKNLYITGYVYANASPGQSESSGLHAWNVVYDNDKWLWVDPTWDDSLAINGNYKYENFMQSEEQFFTNKTHLNITNWQNGKFLDFYSQKNIKQS